MSSEPRALGRVVGERPAAAPRERLRADGRVVAAGAALGLLGQLLFVGVGLGANLVVMVAALLVAAWRVRSPESRLARADAWLPPTALTLAAFVALRSDPALVTLDTLGTLALTGAAVAALAGFPVMTRSALGVGWLGARIVGWAVGAPTMAIGDARAGIRTDGLRGHAGGYLPVVRGLLIALPLLAIFAALFASADAVFARLLGDLIGVEVDLGDLPGRVATIAVIGWLSIGALAFAAGAADEVVGEQVGRPLLGTTEAVTVLLVLDALFAVFVGLQAAYLFGGLDTMAAAGITYSDYARRGFFELCAVAALVGGLLLGMEAIVARRGGWYVAGALALVLLTGAVLASAVLRLGLYQQAYGWTELRFWVAAAIGWMALGLLAIAAALAANLGRWLVHGLVVGAVVVGVTVNLIGPARFVAEQNVARVVHPELVPANGRAGLDVDYLALLGTDAVEPLVAALPDLPRAERAAVLQLLRDHRAQLAETERAWQSWNLARERARDLLEDLP
jgi:Domain of unknown function (DUF4173)